MQDFESYIKTEFDATHAVSTGITYTYTSGITVDKASNKPIKHHSISVTIKCYDSDAKILSNNKITFKDDDISKAQDKKLHNINRSDLVNKFRAAKPTIIQMMISEHQSKINDEQSIINNLRAYVGDERDIIPPMMKGVIDVVENVDTKPQKQSFEM